MSHDLLSFLVRWVHVAGMAFMLGGAVLVWAMSARAGRLDLAEHGRLLVVLAERYERLFWLALGVQVMTGVGNLGAFGVRLPGPATSWGERLTLKLFAVLVLFVFSLLRTMVVIRLGAAGSLRSARAVRVFQSLYGVTAVGLAAITLLAVALAHAA